MDSSDDILVEFVLEAREILDRLDIDFVSLEADPSNQKLIGNIFRAIHTLKGSSGFFSFKRLEKISHAGESLLGRIRDGHLVLDATKTSKLLEMLDVLRVLIEGIEGNKSEPEGEDSQLISDLLKLSSGGEIDLMQSKPINKGEPFSIGDPSTLLEESLSTLPDEGDSTIKAESTNTVPQLDQISSPNVVEVPSGGDPSKSREIAAPVKVNLEVLDKLMNLVSEMVLARNRLLPYTNQYSDLNFSSAVRNIDLLTLELQERMMKMRMQPISHVWSKFPRLIRDVSSECNKKVNLIQEGAETELDRSLIDAIRDPLVHLIRNSIDHSIELPEIRVAQGKPEVANLGLRAKHENGMVVIEIADDGAGINYDLVRKRVVDKNFVDVSAASILTDAELIEFIFLPGFSTKSVVTNLSGRGVGMDVVKNNITNIGGSIEIVSPRGKGTTIQLKIPLTLAIIPALLVSCDQESYAIPQSSILELVRLDLGLQENLVEDFYGVSVFRLREKLVPLIFLAERFGSNARIRERQGILNVVILQSSGAKFGLVVDNVINMQDVVVKPLGPLLIGIPNFAGATILGSGRVALILDVDGIASASEVAHKIQDKPLRQEALTSKAKDDEVAMLLFDVAGSQKMAMPLELVERIVFFDEAQVQKNGNREVVQYTNDIMHLIRISEYIDGAEIARGNSGPLAVIIHQTSQGPIGLAVKKIHDIVNLPEALHMANPPQKGIIGCAILDDQIINVIDLEEILVMRNVRDGPKPYPEVIDVNVWK